MLPNKAIQLQQKDQKAQQAGADLLIGSLFSAMYATGLDIPDVKRILKEIKSKRKGIQVTCRKLSFTFDVPSVKMTEDMLKAIILGEEELHFVVSYIKDVTYDGVVIPLDKDVSEWVTPVYYLMLQLKGLVDILLSLSYVDEASLTVKLSKKLFKGYVESPENKKIEAPHAEFHNLLIETLKQNTSIPLTIGLQDGKTFVTFAYSTVPEKEKWLRLISEENQSPEKVATFNFSTYMRYQLLMSTISLEYKGKVIERTSDAYAEALDTLQFEEIKNMLYDVVYLEEFGWQEGWITKENSNGNTTGESIKSVTGGGE